jgi:hypothetical protein
MDAGTFRPPHPHPQAGGRGDGPRAAGAGTGRGALGCAKRVMPPNLGSEEVVARRTRATGVQAARRRPGEVAARRRSWARRLPPARIPLRAPAVAATDHGRRAPGRAAGIGRREARYATQPGHPEVSSGAPAPRACRLRVGIRHYAEKPSVGRVLDS